MSSLKSSSCLFTKYYRWVPNRIKLCTNLLSIKQVCAMVDLQQVDLSPKGFTASIRNTRCKNVQYMSCTNSACAHT